MKTGSKGLALIKEFEGVRLSAYQNRGDVPTIGYGHTKGVFLGMTCTEAQADAWLAEDVQDAERAVTQAVTVPLNQNQFDALVSIVFNVGPGRADPNGRSGIVVLRDGSPSTLLRMLNAGAYDAAATHFGDWVLGGGVKLNGLIRRREAEKTLFLLPVEVPADSLDAIKRDLRAVLKRLEDYHAD